VLRPGPPADDDRRTAVYTGDLLVFTAVPPLIELCGLTDGLIWEAFGDDPVRAQLRFDADQITERAAVLQRRYRRDPEVKRLFLAALAHVGVNLERTWWDRLQLRMKQYGSVPDRLGAHRDTWGSNIYAQTNWWAPIYPITPDRGLAFYPDYWHRPLANDSAQWDLHEIRAQRWTGAPVQLVPHPTEPVDDGSEVRVAIEPGDLLCFSGAHLHAGVPNHTGEARFSIETRTVDAGDLAAGRGAPNVDGAAPRVARDWFRRVSDDTPLDLLAAWA
jgi:hypothetical protein